MLDPFEQVCDIVESGEKSRKLVDSPLPRSNQSPCLGISNEIDDATIAIDETTILEIKAADDLISTYKILFYKSSFNIKSLFGKSSRDN